MFLSFSLLFYIECRYFEAPISKEKYRILQGTADLKDNHKLYYDNMEANTQFALLWCNQYYLGNNGFMFQQNISIYRVFVRNLI